MSLHLLCDDDQTKSGMTPERQEISRLVKSRMQNLGLPLHDYGEYQQMGNALIDHFIMISVFRCWLTPS